MNARTSCPFLKEVVMVFCDACPAKKLLPRDQVANVGRCATPDFRACPLFRELTRGSAQTEETPEAAWNGSEREARP